MVELMENAAKIVNAMRKLQKQTKFVVEQAEEASKNEDIEKSSASAAEETSKNEKNKDIQRNAENCKENYKISVISIFSKALNHTRFRPTLDRCL